MITNRNHRQDPRRVNTEQLKRVLGARGPKTGNPSPQDRVLVWTDDHRQRDRVLRWQGPCIGCAVQTWSFDDGENDPRGILGDSALWGVDIPQRDGSPATDELEARACPLCANDYDRYRFIQGYAQRNLPTAQPYNWGQVPDDHR